MPMPRTRFVPRQQDAPPTVPFSSAEEAWFWFIQSNDAKAAGARVRAGEAEVPRPCEPIDVLRALDRLYRQRQLVRDHLHVLAHYGRRLMAPDPRRRREMRACGLWDEALSRLDPVLRRKGIIQ
jgi:hypothetical protein